MFFGSKISDPNAKASRVLSWGPESISALGPEVQGDACGIDASALISTMNGPIRAMDLLPGDKLPDGRGGENEVSVVLTSTSQLGQNRVKISAGALGPDLPRHSIVLDPAQRLFVTSDAVENLAGAQGGFVLARDLVVLPGVTLSPAVLSDTVHILFSQHGTLCAEGLCLEAFVPTPATVAALDAEQASVLQEELPKLRYSAGLVTFEHSLSIFDARETARLLSLGVSFSGTPGEDEIRHVVDLAPVRPATPIRQPGSGPLLLIERAAAPRRL